MTIALVPGQFAIFENDTGSNTVAVSLPSNFTFGNFGVTAIAFDTGGAPTIGSVVCGSQNLQFAVGISTANAERTELWYLENATGGNATITATFAAGAGPANRRMSAAEFSGLVTALSIDKLSSGTNNNTAFSSGTITPTNNNELLIGAGQYNAMTLNAAAGWNVLEEGADKEAALWYKVQTTATTEAFSGTVGGGVWGAVVASFIAASGGIVSSPLMGQSCLCTSEMECQNGIWQTKKHNGIIRPKRWI